MTQELEKPEAEDETLKLLNYMIHDLQHELYRKDVVTSLEKRVFLWLLFRLARYPQPQKQHIEQNEVEWICYFRQHGMTLEDIAYVFDRSKSSVHDVLERNGESTE